VRYCRWDGAVEKAKEGTYKRSDSQAGIADWKGLLKKPETEEMSFRPSDRASRGNVVEESVSAYHAP